MIATINAKKTAQTSQSTPGNQCPECGAYLVITETGYVCSECGLCDDDPRFLYNYSFYDNSDLLNSPFQSQKVSLGNTSANLLNEGSHYGYFKKGLTAKRMERYQLNAIMKNKETIFRIMDVIHYIGCYLNLTQNLQERIAYLYRKHHDKAINCVTLAATCVYVAIKEKMIPISIHNITEAFQKFGHRVQEELIIRDVFHYGFKTNFQREQIVANYITKGLYQIKDAIGGRLTKKNPLMDVMQYLRALDRQCVYFYKRLIPHVRGCHPEGVAYAIIYAADCRLMRVNPETKRILSYSIIEVITGLHGNLVRDLFNTNCREYLNEKSPKKTIRGKQR